MSPVKVPVNLPDLVRTTFNKAKANDDVNFYPTQVAVLTPAASTPIQLRFAPSLANKPKSPPSSKEHANKPFNPFEDPPPALIITRLEPDHILVLNKFAIVPEHFLLITRTFKHQTHLLDADDLAATYACIRAYHEYPPRRATIAGDEEGKERKEEEEEEGKNQKGLFAFFNCGEHSGASQPHRHLQLLPVASMREGLADAAGTSWDVLADKLVRAGDDGGGEGPKLPFLVFGERLRPDMEAKDLRAAYLRLYRKACEAAGQGQVPTDVDDEDRASDGVEARISYNMALTRDAMVLCPRTAEGSVVLDRRRKEGEEEEEGREMGKLALNGTLLAGTALVKTQGQWDALRNDPLQLWEILGKIGIAV
ncbi:HIT-like protein [Cryphonectria parasitica EP155]|uniref:HIT-like protein n=1 Tax=Cryphonectria parasitica (strain ATCC 38755 / EP155) TaxID=660469 RepID=A0A9P4YAN0_CRYP1|nr:HIT-like protein [Cryphonectria parasitica EP155]KAF3769525.1 HIT-like protein [Cryphonectria parasitica EP155]